MTLPVDNSVDKKEVTGYPLSDIESDFAVVVSALGLVSYDPHKVTALLVKAGFIKKYPCYCGSTKVEAHHQDYAKPLKVVWFCGRHHRMHHEALRSEGKDVQNRHLVRQWKSRNRTQSEINDERRANLVKARASRKLPLKGRIPTLASLLLVTLLTPAFPQRAAHMFVLSEIARKSYGQFSLVFETLVTPSESITEVTLQSPLEPGALPPVLDELAKKYRPFIDRVLTRLSEAERKEVNLHLQQDIRQAWITVSYAQRMSDAFVQASYAIYGKHPDQIWPSIVADRKARLGAEYYEWYSSDDMLRPDVPKISGRTAVGLADSSPQASTRLEPEVRTGVFVSLPDSKLPPRPADTHAANGADLPTGTGQVGSVPTERKTV